MRKTIRLSNELQVSKIVYSNTYFFCCSTYSRFYNITFSDPVRLGVSDKSASDKSASDKSASDRKPSTSNANSSQDDTMSLMDSDNESVPARADAKKPSAKNKSKPSAVSFFCYVIRKPFFVTYLIIP